MHPIVWWWNIDETNNTHNTDRWICWARIFTLWPSMYHAFIQIHKQTRTHTHGHRNWQTPTLESIYFVWHFFFLSRSHSLMFIYIRFHSLYCAMLNNRMWSINENCKLHVRFSSVFIVVFLCALVAIHFRWWCMHFLLLLLEFMLPLLIFRCQ